MASGGAKHAPQEQTLSQASADERAGRHRTGLRRDHRACHPAADAPGLQPCRHMDRPAHRAVHGHERRLRHRPGRRGYGDPLVRLRPLRAPCRHPDWRPGRDDGHRAGGDDDEPAHRPSPAHAAGGERRHPAHRRHRAPRAPRAVRHAAARACRRAAACPALCPAARPRPRRLLCGVSRRLRVLQRGL